MGEVHFVLEKYIFSYFSITIKTIFPIFFSFAKRYNKIEDDIKCVSRVLRIGEMHHVLRNDM